MNMTKKTIYTSILSALILGNYLQSSTNPQNASDVLRLLEHEFKNPEYIQIILPNDFSHLVSLFSYGKQTQQECAYILAVLHPFANMIKGSEYVNVDAFIPLLKQLPELLEHYVIPNKMKSYLQLDMITKLETYERLQQSVNTMLFSHFSSNFDLFQEQPEAFIENVSIIVRDIVYEELEIEKFRHAVIRFLDTCLSKLIWNPEEQTACWQSVINISQELSKLLEKNIIEDINDLDDLYWTLIHRFGFFVQLMSTHLNVETYEHIKYNISSSDLLLFELEEQDTWIEHKKDYLINTLLKAEAVCRAQQKGIVI